MLGQTTGAQDLPVVLSETLSVPGMRLGKRGELESQGRDEMVGQRGDILLW